MADYQFKGGASAYKAINASKLNSTLASSYAKARKLREDEEATNFARQELQNKINSGELNQDGTEKRKPGFFDYLNPLGEYGLFGSRNVAQSTKVINDVAGEATKGINSAIGGEEDGKLNDVRDVVRFAANLPVGMVQGALNAPKDFREATTGVRLRTDESGRYDSQYDESITGLQRLGAGANAAINTLGLAAGGSGRLIDAAIRKGGAEATKSGAKNVAKEVVKNSLIEGGEEAAQSLATDLQETGGFDSGTLDRAAKGFAMGVVAGGIFDASSRGVTAIKQMPNKSKNTTGAAEKLIQNLPEDVVAQPGFVDNINRLAEEATNVGEFKTNFENYAKEVESSTNTQLSSQDAQNAETPSGNPEQNAIVEGPTERQARVLGKVDERLAEIDESLGRLQRNEDPSVFRTIASDGTDVTSTAANFDNQLSQIDQQVTALARSREQLQRQAEGIDNTTGIATVPDGVDPSEFSGDTTARAKAQEGMTAIDAQIAELQSQRTSVAEEAQNSFETMGGVTREIDTALAAEKFRTLQNEKRAAREYKLKNTPEQTAQSVEQQIADIDRGVVPEEFLLDTSPANNSREAVMRSMKADPQDTLGIQEAFEINEGLIADANERKSRLFTEDKYQSFMAELDANYDAKMEEISQYPGPRATEEKALLDADYEAQMRDARVNRDNDASEAAELDQAIEVGRQIDQNIIDEWNSMEQSNPQAFADVDQDSLDLYRESLVKVGAEKAINENPSMDPIQKVDAVAAATSESTTKSAVKTDLDENTNIRDAADEVLADALTSGKTDVTVVDSLLREPSTWLDRWGTAGKSIKGHAEVAIAGMNRFNGKLQDRYKSNKWGIALKPKYADQSVDFLNEGIPLYPLKREGEAHFNNRVKAANDMKQWFRDVGRELNLPEDMVMKDYLPHIFERESGLKMDDIAKTMEQLRVGKTDKGHDLTQKGRERLVKKLDGVDAQTRQFIESKRIYKYENGHMIKRQGADGWSRDLPSIISEYARTASKDIYMKPALTKIDKDSVVLEKDQLNLLDTWVKQWRGEPASNFDKQLGKTKIPGTNISAKSALSGARRLQNVALMGASARTVVLQTGGIVNIFAESKSIPQFLQSGITAISSNKKGSKLRSEAFSEGVMDGSFSGLITGGKGISALATKGEKALYSGISLVDENMRIWAYDMGKKEYAKSLGKSLNQLNPSELAAAKKAGVEKAKTTQFNMDALSIPVGQNTEVGKLITQIQQFNLKQTAYNAKLFYGNDSRSPIYKNSDGQIKFSKEGATRLAKAMVGYGVLISTMTSFAGNVFGEEAEQKLNLLGLDWEDFIPFGEQVVSGAQVLSGQKDAKFQSLSTPLLSFLMGSERGDGVTDYISAASKFASGDIDQAEYDATMAKLPGFLTRNLLPGGTQLVRSLEGGQAVGQGESRNAQGSTRFLVNNKDGWNVMKGLIGGQYATDEGQEWLRTGMQTINKNTMVDMPDGTKVPVSEYARSLSSEEQAQWIGYYSTKQQAEKQLSNAGRSKGTVTDDIRQRLTKGLISQAQAKIEAQKWNNDLLGLYSPYLSGNKSIPPRLTYDLLNKTLINVTTLKPKTNRISDEEEELLQSFYDSEGY